MVQQREVAISSWKQTHAFGASPSLYLASDERQEGWKFTFETIKSNLFRTTFSSESHQIPPVRNAQTPKQDLIGTKPIIEDGEVSRNIQVGNIRIGITWENTPVVSIKWKNSPTFLYQDLPRRSYIADGDGIAHYSVYNRNTLHVGLGEKAAPFDLSGRSFIMSATDCFGYDVYRTDPMYKHIPLLINASPEGCVGIFSTSHARGQWSLDTEIDGLWGRYKVYRQAYGGLEEYLIVGKCLRDIVETYAGIVGYPKLVPRWGFGYLCGGMKYSMLDEPRAADALMGLVDKFEEHDIPCSAYQMSSGYTVAETEPKTRNVFTWNKNRFPDPEQFVEDFHARGMRLIMNVKPYVLENHPEYLKLVQSRSMFIDPETAESAVARLWSAGGGESGPGGHIDFTSKSGFQWWYNGIQALRKIGVDSIWNDNNEFTVPNDNWQCSLDYTGPNFPGTTGLPAGSDRTIGFWGRALHTELMAQSSHAALSDLNPASRPFILTRSATPGTMRYANHTWSGDNVTSWASMKGSTALSLNSGLSLLQVSGHDIGGFEGPQPTPELLVRWVQLGIYSPKFAINCYKTSPKDNTVGDVIEPWMYPEVTHLIRDAIKRRYEILPYIYSLALTSHLSAAPPMRWTGWEYEFDPEVWKSPLKDGETQFWFGKSLLVAGVFEEGATETKVYLPRLDGYHSDEQIDNAFILLSPLSSPSSKPIYLRAGQWHTINSPYSTSIPIIARTGTAVQIGHSYPTRSDGESSSSWPSLSPDTWRGLEIFPRPPASVTAPIPLTTTWYEDDGTSRFPDITSFNLFWECSTRSTTTITTTTVITTRTDVEAKTKTETTTENIIKIYGLHLVHVPQNSPVIDPAQRVELQWKGKANNVSSHDEGNANLNGTAITIDADKHDKQSKQQEANSRYLRPKPKFIPLWLKQNKALDIIMPAGDERRVFDQNGKILEDRGLRGGDDGVGWMRGRGRVWRWDLSDMKIDFGA